ncbi:MAG: Ubiquinone/menaquinone biosynthesis C-methyltransferase UbiE [Candidatus Heimdallarchaeota archaeon LC_2]|nr:MAG: Ubiquinone/menaquinone biosynthesis C-methyltransferase UbiE [Candidatus Heimdallarchaeota archaeon LC_2]
MVKSETISIPKKVDLSETVNENYSNIARQLLDGTKASCCEDPKIVENQNSCCEDDQGVIELENRINQKIPSLGSDKDLIGFAKPAEGEMVVDLGSGPGNDAFKFAREIGSTGKIIGIDFSDDMLKLARRNMIKEGITNAEFRKGSIEDIPVNANTVDLIISNCVINLAENREKVFNSAYKILKEGGRIVFSDLVVKDTPSKELANNIDAVCGCYAGTTKSNYLTMLKKAGFKDIKATDEYEFTKNFGGSDIEYSSTIFQGVK